MGSIGACSGGNDLGGVGAAVAADGTSSVISKGSEERVPPFFLLADRLFWFFFDALDS